MAVKFTDKITDQQYASAIAFDTLTVDNSATGQKTGEMRGKYGVVAFNGSGSGAERGYGKYLAIDTANTKTEDLDSIGINTEASVL